MKNIEIGKRNNYLELPPVGAYIAEIQDARLIPTNYQGTELESLEMMVEITEGDYKGRYHEIFKDQDERFGNAKYKGVFRLYYPSDNSAEWMDSKFSHNIWCVQDSNGKKPDGSYIYVWTFDGDVKQLKGKKVGINVRKRIYEYNGQVRETTEIGQFETVDDVRNGKCKPMKDRDTRKNSSDEPQFTEVSASEVSVPW